MPSLKEILNDPNYVNANEATKEAIFNKYSAIDENYTGANEATKDAIRQRFGVVTPLQKPIVAAPAEEKSPILGSFEKGIVGGKQAIKQAQLAGLMDLQAANKEKYGDTYQAAPKEELDKITALDKSIVEKLQAVAQYGVERKEIEAKRGVNPLMQEVRNIGASDAYKNADTIDQLKMYGDAVWSKKSDIPGYIASIGLESLPASIPSIAAAMAVKFGGMGPKATAIAGGGGSALTEFGNQYAELRAEGLNHKEAWEKAGVKSGVIGMFDAASFYSAGSAASTILKNVEKGAIKATVKETGKGIGTQALYGMAGEAGGSLAIGQKLDPIQIIEEGLGEVVGAPLEAVSTYRQNVAEANKPKFTTDEKGNLVKTEGTAPPASPAPGAPIPAGAQQGLFTQEEAPFQLTPDELTAQTQAGQTVETPALQANERAQAEIERGIFALQQQEQTPEVQAQIAELQSQLQQGPGATLDTLKVEYETLERKKLALADIRQQLIEQRDAVPSLDAKLPISQQLNAIEEQGAQIAARQQELLSEGKTTAKKLPAAEETVVEPELNVENTITEDDFKTMGIGRTNKKLREAILGKKLSDPVEKQAVIDALTAYAQDKNRSASISTKVGEFIDGISKETQNVPRGDVSGAVPGGSESSVRVPSISGVTPGATQTSIAGGVASPVGTAGGPDVGEGGVREAGAAPLVAQTTTPTPAAQAPSTELDESRRLSENFNKGNPAPVKTGWFRTKLGQWQKVREGNLNIGSFLFGTAQNFASSDQAYQNLMRKVMFDLAKAGDITFKQAKQALMRIATTQTTKRAELAKEMLRRGAWEYDPVNNWWTATDDANNIGVFDELTTKLAQRLGINEQEARKMMDDGYEANRLNSYFEDLNKAKGDLTRVQKKIDLLQKNRKRTKAEQKDLNTKIGARDKLVKDIDVLEGKVQHKERSQVQDGMKLYNMHPEIQEGTRVWNDMRARTVKTLVDVGMLSEEKAQQWLDEAAYVPFFRDIGEQAEAKPDQLISSGLRETMAPLRAKQKGSMLKVSSTTENMKEWMQWALAGAVSNQQLNTMLDTYKSMLPDEVREGKGPEGTTFTVYRDGVERSYNVENPAIAQAFTRLAPMIFPGLAMYKAVNNISRHTITRFPLFSVMQVPADLYQAFFTSGIKNPTMLVANILKEVALTTAKMSETRDKLKANAIINTEDFNAMNEADAIGQRVSEVTTSKFKKPWQWAMHTLDKFASVSDNVVRQAVFNELVREGKSEQEAMIAAAEIINFRRMSANPTLQKLSQTTMFFNPWLQILSVTMKTLSGKGITPQTRAAGAKVLAAISGQVFTLGFLVAAANDDDENEQEKKARQVRDRLIMIPGTGGMGIPIRMDVFAIPYFLGMDTYHMMMKHEFVDSKSVRASLSAAVKGSLLPPTQGVPQLALPPVEAVLNKDIHNNRPLVSPSMERLEAELQFNKATSEFARVLGEKTNISPIKIEHVLRGYFGTVYALFNLMANNTIADMRGIPRPAETWRETIAKVPNIGVAVGKGTDMGEAAVSDFYEMAEDVSGILESAKRIGRTDLPKAEEYLRKNESKIVGIEGINRALSDLRKAENDILNARAKSAQYPEGMSAQEKATALKEINAERKSLTKDIRDMRKQVYK
jgi:hypothetical protein